VTIALDLQPDIERGLLAQARARGVSLAAYAQEVLAREAKAAASSQRRTGQELIDACAKVRGLLTDEEVDTLFRRSHSFSRPVDFE
jgi:post-segregation antitoxin (ccd killing protein)